MTDASGGDGCVLVVDDNEFNRVGLGLYLRGHEYATVEAGDEESAFALAMSHRPASAVVDIVIPTTPDGKAHTSQSVGLRLVRRLKELDPAMGIVIFSAYEDRGGEIWDLIRDGVRGVAYLLKGSRPERLLLALDDTRAGRVILDGEAGANKPQLAAEIRARLSPAERPWVEEAVRLMPTLSPRELDVARRLAGSHNRQGLVDGLGITAKTVDNHINRLYEKLGLGNLEAAAPTLRKSVLLAKACMLNDLMYGNDAGPAAGA